MQPQPSGQTQGRTVLYCVSPGRKGIRVLAPAHLDQGANSRNPEAALGKSGLRALAIVKTHPPASKSYMVKICHVGSARSQAASSGGGRSVRPRIRDWGQAQSGDLRVGTTEAHWQNRAQHLTESESDSIPVLWKSAYVSLEMSGSSSSNSV